MQVKIVHYFYIQISWCCVSTQKCLGFLVFCFSIFVVGRALMMQYFLRVFYSCFCVFSFQDADTHPISFDLTLSHFNNMRFFFLLKFKSLEVKRFPFKMCTKFYKSMCDTLMTDWYHAWIRHQLLVALKFPSFTQRDLVISPTYNSYNISNCINSVKVISK